MTIDGVLFCRDDRTGYYLNSVLSIRAHRFVYERAFGPIPEGYAIHHKDGDKANNALENLELISATEHAQLHLAERYSDPDTLAWARANLDRAREKASEWHRSPEGREWHREHAKRVAANLKPREYRCEGCGVVFEKKPHARIAFCSKACKAAARRASGVDDEPRSCVTCGATFMANKYVNHKTCSPPCRLASRRSKAAAQRQKTTV